MAEQCTIRRLPDVEAATALRALEAFRECGAAPLSDLSTTDSPVTGQAAAMLGILATFVENDGKDWNRELLAQAIRGAETLLWLDRFAKDAADRAAA